MVLGLLVLGFGYKFWIYLFYGGAWGTAAFVWSVWFLSGEAATGSIQRVFAGLRLPEAEKPGEPIPWGLFVWMGFCGLITALVYFGFWLEVV